ncbi:Uncharacterised protein [Bordetella pertussis]|nr:Uncharacterised protein [Bordetella pertussis]
MRWRTSSTDSLRSYSGVPSSSMRHTRPLPSFTLGDSLMASGHGCASSSGSISSTARLASM